MASQKIYDKYKRNKDAKRFYDSAAWRRCRLIVLQRDNYLCQECLRKGKVTPADAVHHIVELLDDWSRALDEKNLESICDACHNKEHAGRGKETKVRKRRIRVIKA